MRWPWLFVGLLGCQQIFGIEGATVRPSGTGGAGGVLEGGGGQGASGGGGAEPYTLAVLADGPIAYWRFEDAPGAEVAEDDAVDGPDLPGTYTELATLVPGVVGTAIRLSVGGGYMRVLAPSDEILQFTDVQPFSVEAWIYVNSLPEPGSEGYVISNQGDDGNGVSTGWRLSILPQSNECSPAQPNSGCLRFVRKQDNVEAATFEGLTADRWYHVVGTYDDDAMESRLYVDGELVDSHPNQATILDHSRELRVGTTSSQQVEAFVDEVAVYDEALAPNRVEAHFAAAPGG